MNWKQNFDIDDIYVRATNGKIPLVGNSCPVCNSGKLHIYVHVFNHENGKGSGWIWCDHCHSYDHFRGPLPEWWADIEPLDIKPLDIPPKHLSEYTQKIDERNKQIEAHF